MQKVSVNVRGKSRTVNIGTQLGPNKWHGKIYVSSPRAKGGRATVSGIYQVYSSGSKRFTPTGVNADLLS